jgi:hypothetical protein
MGNPMWSPIIKIQRQRVLELVALAVEDINLLEIFWHISAQLSLCRYFNPIIPIKYLSNVFLCYH